MFLIWWFGRMLTVWNLYSTDPDVSIDSFASSVSSIVKVTQNLILSVQDYLINKLEATSWNYKPTNRNLEYHIFYSENSVKIFAEEIWNL